MKIDDAAARLEALARSWTRLFRSHNAWIDCCRLEEPIAMNPATTGTPRQQHEYNSSEMGAIAHLYRAEVYRSTIWRTRLDNTTNWSIVAMGIALSTTFASRDASPLPLLLVGLLLAMFLSLEARRYRYFNVWRARARWLETHWYAPMLTGRTKDEDGHWQTRLADDYLRPRHHITFARAVGRRLRRSYIWLFAIQSCAYYGKIAVHPLPVASFEEFVARAAIGPIPGSALLVAGGLYNVIWIALTLSALWLDWRKHSVRREAVSMG